MMKIKCPKTGEVMESESCEAYKEQYPALVRLALERKDKQKKDPNTKPRFGVGTLVKDCMREAYYHLTEDVYHTPEKLWIFERGHAIHEYFQAKLSDDKKEIFKEVTFPHFNIIGFVDAIHDDILYELKTTSNSPSFPQSHHVLQAQGYFSMLSPEEQARIKEINIVYISMHSIKTFSIPKRNILPFLEAKGLKLTNALKINQAPEPTFGWQCKVCDFKDLCSKEQKKS